MDGNEPRCLSGFCAVLISIIVSLLAWTTTLHAQDTLAISGLPDYPPFIWQQDGHIIGIGAEPADMVFGDVGLTVVSHARGSWKRLRAESKAGTIDAAVGIYYTEQRNRYLADPNTLYMEDKNVLRVANGREFTFETWEDLVGKHGTAMLGESYGEKLDQFLKKCVRMDLVNIRLQNLKKLALDRADFYPLSLDGGEIQLGRNGFGGKVVHLPMGVSRESVYIALSKKSRFADPHSQRNEAIRKQRADGITDHMVNKYVALAAQSGPPR